MRLQDCHNTRDFRELARRRLPAPIFHYIDGAADDEVTCRRNITDGLPHDSRTRPAQPEISLEGVRT